MAQMFDPKTVRGHVFDGAPDPWDVANFIELAKPFADRLLREIAQHHDIKLPLLSWDSLRQRIEHHVALAIRDQAKKSAGERRY